MENNGVSVTCYYYGLIDLEVDKALEEMALSYSGYRIAQWLHWGEPHHRENKFEFSNEERAKQFVAELHHRYSSLVQTYGPWEEKP